MPLVVKSSLDGGGSDDGSNSELESDAKSSLNSILALKAQIEHDPKDIELAEDFLRRVLLSEKEGDESAEVELKLILLGLPHRFLCFLDHFERQIRSEELGFVRLNKKGEVIFDFKNGERGLRTEAQIALRWNFISRRISQLLQGHDALNWDLVYQAVDLKLPATEALLETLSRQNLPDLNQDREFRNELRLLKKEEVLDQSAPAKAELGSDNSVEFSKFINELQAKLILDFEARGIHFLERRDFDDVPLLVFQKSQGHAVIYTYDPKNADFIEVDLESYDELPKSAQDYIDNATFKN